MINKIGLFIGAVGLAVGIVGAIIGVMQGADAQRLKEDNQVLKKEVINTKKEIENGNKEVSKLKYELDKATSGIFELKDSLNTLRCMLLDISNDNYAMIADLKRAIVKTVEKQPASSQVVYSKDPGSIERQNSEIIAASTGGIYWVMIGYSSTEEDSKRQVELAKSRGFKNAWYNVPIRGNPYYGICAGPSLSWDAAVKLRDLAKNTFYGSEAWIWQP